MQRIEDCVNFLLGKAAQAVSRRTRDAFAPHGVTPVQFATLSVLWEGDGLSCSDLGVRLTLDSATMTGVVDRLESAGHVERRPDPDGDRRINRIYLTARGRAVQAPLTAAMSELNAQVSRMLGDRDAVVRAALRELGGEAPSGRQ